MSFSAPTSYGSLPAPAIQALSDLMAREDPTIVGIILTGSAARGMATRHSDVDIMVVRDEQGEVARDVTRSSAIDEIPLTLAELETVKPVGSDGAWERWSFAWAQVLRDSLGGRVVDAVRKQAMMSEQETHDLLIGRSRLDEFVNLAYRALKSHRDGRPEAARLDSAESVASMLDVVFALSGRVRPYNKYLAWELGEHPLPNSDWQDGRLLDCVSGLLDGSEVAVRQAFLTIEKECRAYDRLSRQDGMSKIIEDWGDELHLLHGH